MSRSIRPIRSRCASSRSIRPWPAALLFSLIALLPTGCASVIETLQGARPTARIAGVRIADLGLDHLQLEFDLEVQNHASAPLPLLGLEYDLASGGQSFLWGASDVGGTVAPGGSRTVSLPLRVGFRETLDVLSGVRPGQVFPYRAEIDLSVDAPVLGRIELPLAHEGTLPVPTVPRVELSSIAWDEISLSRVGGTVSLQVVNTNDFAVTLQSLSCALRLGETKVGDLSARPNRSLEPGAAAALEIPLGFAPLDLGAGLVDLLRGSGSSYGVEGAIAVRTDFGSLAMPYSTSGQVAFAR